MLAKKFAALVRRDLAEHLDEINRRNATPDYSLACATHDYCDANMLMLEAFRDVFNRDPDAASQSDTDAMNAAWDAARAAAFRL